MSQTTAPTAPAPPRQRPWWQRWLPNLLTASRMVVPFTAWLVYHAVRKGHPAAATIWLVVTGLITATDFADGRLARRWEVVSDLGKQLDPILDKLVLLAVFGLFVTAVIQTGPLSWPYLVCAAVLAGRLWIELGLMAWARRAKQAGEIPGANWHGKLKFCLDGLAAALGWSLLIWGSSVKVPLAAAVFCLPLVGAIYYGWLSLKAYNFALEAK